MNENMKVKWFTEEIEVYDEKRVVNKTTNTITLNYIPSKTRPLTVENKGIILAETSGIPSENQFVVDRENGLLLFNSAMSGKVMVINYAAAGQWCISADKVYTNTDNKGDVIETLEEYMDKNKEIIESVKTVGDGAKVVQEMQGAIDSITGLVGDIIEGENVNNALISTISTARSTNSNLNNTTTMANNKINEMNAWVNSHGDIVNLDERVEDLGASYSKIANEDIPNINSSLENIENNISEYNVMNYGFDKTGLTDNSSLLNDLINFVYENGGGVIKFPQGIFRIDNTIVCKPYVYLIGNMPWRGKEKSGYTVFDCYSLNSEQFLLREYCSLSNFYFNYPLQKDRDSDMPIAYDWTIKTDTTHLCDDIQLSDLYFPNSYKAISLVRGGRLNLNNIYGNPIFKGLYIDDSRDMNHLNRIEFWTFTYYVGSKMFDYIQNNADAFEFGTADGLICNNLFAYGYKRGYNLQGGVWGTFTGCCADKCYSPINVDNCNIVEFLGGSFIGASFKSIICNIKNVSNSFKLIGCNFFGGNGIGVLNRSDSGKILIDCNFKKNDDIIKIPIINCGYANVIVRKNHDNDIVIGQCSVDGVNTILGGGEVVKIFSKNDFGFNSDDVIEIPNGFRIDLGKTVTGEKIYNGSFRIDEKSNIPVGYYYLEFIVNGSFSTDRKRMNISIKKDDGSQTYNNILNTIPMVDGSSFISIPVYLGNKPYITLFNLFVSYYDEVTPTGDFIDITGMKLVKMGSKIMNSTIENAYKTSYVGVDKINYNLDA